MSPSELNVGAREFLAWAVPEMSYVLTGAYEGSTSELVLSAQLRLFDLVVCTGSWLLAGTGALDGKTATTNKALYTTVVVSHLVMTYK